MRDDPHVWRSRRKLKALSLRLRELVESARETPASGSSAGARVSVRERRGQNPHALGNLIDFIYKGVYSVGKATGETLERSTRYLLTPCTFSSHPRSDYLCCSINPPVENNLTNVFFHSNKNRNCHCYRIL